MKNQKRLDNKGFSLVELIVVIAIMAVLMGVLAPTLIGNIEKSRESTDLQNLDTIRGAAVTAMANEAVNSEITTKAKTNGYVAISLGTAQSASVDTIDATKYPEFKEDMQEIISSSITMKSGAAKGNTVYVVITSKGAVTAVISSAEPTASDFKAVECDKTEDENGDPKKLLSGANS